PPEGVRMGRDSVNPISKFALRFRIYIYPEASLSIIDAQHTIIAAWMRFPNMYIRMLNRRMLKCMVAALMSGVAITAQGQLAANAYSFLDVSSATHALALGGYAIALSGPDPMMVDQNPSLLGPEVGRVAALSYMRYFGSSNFAAARYAQSAGERGAWAIGVRYLDYGSIDGYTQDGSYTGSFRPQDIAVEGTYSHDFTDRLRGGINAKLIYSNYEEYTAVALAADLGINYYDDEKDLSLSAVIKNAGGQVKRFNESYDHLPFDIQLGYMQGLANGPFSLSITAHHLTHWKLPSYSHGQNNNGNSGSDSDTETENYKFIPTLFRHLAFGLQYSPSDRFYVALGYNYKTRGDMSTYQRNFLSGFSLGVGLNVSDFAIGVSFSQPHKSASTLGLNLAYFL
ncbi:MAG: type IX secretion system protein PorQ, partial [Muribaculaceae bacterium]|nr:type IX secretion system protein PorQ [Muribaculaceae bacterium]